MPEGPEADKAGRVLVCDDEPMPRHVLSSFLAKHGYAVETAADGDEACRLAEAAHFDVILLDLFLPKRDGYTVLLHLRGVPGHARTPVILISAEPAELHAETARTLGAAGFIQKPFELPEVLQRVQEVQRAAADRGAPEERA